MHRAKATECGLAVGLIERGQRTRSNRSERLERLRQALTTCEVRGEKTLGVFPLTLLSEIASRSGEMEEAALYLRRAQEITSGSRTGAVSWRRCSSEGLMDLKGI